MTCPSCTSDQTERVSVGRKGTYYFCNTCSKIFVVDKDGKIEKLTNVLDGK